MECRFLPNCACAVNQPPSFGNGLVERRGADLDDGLTWLVETVTAHAHLGPEELCDVLLRESLTHDDDQVLLAVRACP
mgnify:CR=1 FL=1